MARRRTKIVKVAEAKPAVMRPGERVTLVRSDSPKIVAKQFRVEGGRLVKESVANIISGLAWSKAADDAESFAAILRECSSRTNVCLIPGRFTGDDIDGKSFRLVDEKALARMLKKQPGDEALAGIHDIGGTRVSARLKRSITHAAWVLLDADDAPGMPEEMRVLDLHQRLEAFEKLIPGIAKAERILSRSSSFRVRHRNEPPRRHGHAWLRVSDPTKVEVLRTHLKIASVNADLAFPSPRYARFDDPKRGNVIGHEMRTLFDLSVLIPGRLVFIARPILGDSATEAGYVLDDPGIVIENAGCGALDISAIELPTTEMLAEHNRITGTRTTISSSGAAVGIHVRGELKADTPIERRGVEKPLSEWLADLKPGAKLRCEAPFRASASEAAFIVKHEDGSAIVHDVGVSTTWSWPGPDGDDTDDDDARPPLAPKPANAPRPAASVVRSAMAALGDDFDARGRFRIGVALKWCVGPPPAIGDASAGALFVEFSRRQSDWNRERAIQEWAKFLPNGEISFDTIAWHARQRGWRDFDYWQQRFEQQEKKAQRMGFDQLMAAMGQVAGETGTGTASSEINIPDGA